MGIFHIFLPRFKNSAYNETEVGLNPLTQEMEIC